MIKAAVVHEISNVVQEASKEERDALLRDQLLALAEQVIVFSARSGMSRCNLNQDSYFCSRLIQAGLSMHQAWSLMHDDLEKRGFGADKYLIGVIEW